MKNIKDNSKKNSIIKKIAMSTLAIGLSVGIFALNMTNGDPNFSKYKSNYNSDLAYIKQGSAPSTTDYISMTDAAANGSNNGKTISIENAAELALFSTTTNSTATFLDYDYVLIDNIDYSDETTQFTPVGYNLGQAFTGRFDGQGYEISNLHFASTLSVSQDYYSMFWLNGKTNDEGTITNLGLISPYLKLQSINEKWGTEDYGVSYLVGKNSSGSTVSNCFIIDKKISNDDYTGILAEGCFISTLCVKNEGSLSDNYVVIDTVVDPQQSNLLEWTEIEFTKKANAQSTISGISNCYYYNNAISYISGTTTYYKEDYININTKTDLYAGEYKTEEALKTQLNTDGWKTASSYGVYSDHVGIDYGIRRGVSYDSTTHALEIASAKDFAYMYELFNTDDYMASNNAIYNITADINLAKLPVKTYTYEKGIGATIEGIEITNDNNKSLTLMDNNKSSYPTIYNAKILDSSRATISTGVECYGLFNYFTGTVKNLNVYVNNTDANINSVTNSNTSKDICGIGVLSGYIEKGFVDNVNVYANFTNSTNKNTGEYNLGGITGILGGSGAIRNSTAAGAMTLNATTSTLPSSDDYMHGIAIGGIVGYIEASLGNVNTCTSAVNITCNLGTSTTYAIGGVIGAGYTTNYNYTKTVDNKTVKVTDKTANLENDGTISVGQTSPTYSRLYVAGIIGRHLGMTDQVENFNNSGAIAVVANGNTTFVAGVENSDIITSGALAQETGSGLEASQLKRNDGKTLFYASSFTNGEEVSVSGSSTNLNYTNVLNINAKGNNENTAIVSVVDGIFNLAYNEKYDDGSIKSTALNAQSIYMNVINTFAPVLNVVDGTNVATTTASMLYNLRPINYSTSAAVAENTIFRYAGVALGNYISYDDIRNEGDLTFSLANNAIGAGSKLYASGVFDTLSLNCTAGDVYNGGNISVFEPNGSTANKNLDMYLSGICYQNLAVDSSANQNPLNAEFDSELNGTLYNVINKGNISVDSYYVNKTETVDNAPSNHVHYNGNIYVGGISYINSGIISSAFNLGNISLNLYSTEVKNYQAAGISCIMDGTSAQIRDSANNGDITIIDLCQKDTIKSKIISGGIVAINEKSKANIGQILAFTINYGTLNVFSSYKNTITTDSINNYNSNYHAVAGGILGVGICNMVDIVNYGNIYSSEAAAGIVSIVRLKSFNVVNASLANTVNYGNVRINPIYYGVGIYQSYNSIVSLENLRGNDVQLLCTLAGSICSIFDFGSQNNVSVRYLINLYDGCATVLYSINNPSGSIDISTFITARGANDEFGGSTDKITYAPLTSLEDQFGNVGVFSSKFVFRKAINGEGLDSTKITDSYIPNFFQFVIFDKVNQNLLDEIGWRTIAYSSAAEDLVKNVEALSVLVNASRPASTTDLLADAFTGSTWISTINEDILESLINTSLESGELNSSIRSLLEFTLFDSSSKSSYTQAIKNSIIETILTFYAKQGEVDYYVVLQSLLYDELVAKVISEDDANYAQVKDKILEILETSNNLEQILSSYLTELQSDTSNLNVMFSGSTSNYYENPKIKLIDTLLAGYDTASIYSIYQALDLENAVEDTIVKYKLYMQQNPEFAREIYSGIIANNNFTNADYLSFINTAIDKYSLSDIIDFSSNNNTDDFGNITDTNGYKYQVIANNDQSKTASYYRKYVDYFDTKNITSLDITPTKNYTQLWNVIKQDADIQDYISDHYFNSYTNPTTSLTETGMIAKATEWNNSYQTNDRPMSSYPIPVSFDYGLNYGWSGQPNYYNSTDNYTNDTPMFNRFIYVPDNYNTYRTSYLGPYQDINGNCYDQTVSGSTKLSSNTYDYNKGKDLTTVDTGTQTTRGTVPILFCLNETLAKNLIAESHTSAENKSLYQFHWNTHNGKGVGRQTDSDYMWKEHNFITHAATNTTGYIYNNYNSGTYMCDYYNFDPEVVYTQNIEKDINVTLPNGVTTNIKNQEESQHTYRQYYLTAHCTSAIITGLWYTYSSWPNGGVKCVSLLAKSDKKTYNKYCGVHTTDYICYDIEDLVALDGVRTKGFYKNNPYNWDVDDEDEVNIISAIVTQLITDNKKLVLKAIASYSKDHDFTSSDASVINYLITSLTDTNFSYESVTEYLRTIKDTNYSALNTVSEYLASRNIVLTDYRDLIIVGIISDKNKFAQFLLKIMGVYSEKSYQYATYVSEYSRTAIDSFLYEYLTYVYDSGSTLTEAQIDAILASVSDADLTNLVKLFQLDFTRKHLDSYTESSTGESFTINDALLIDWTDPEYDSNYDTDYERVLVGETNYDSAASPVVGSNITFTTSTWGGNFSLDVKFKGTVHLVGNNTTVNYTHSSLQTHRFNSLAANTTYTLYFDQGTALYKYFLLQNDQHTGSGYVSMDVIKTPVTSLVAATGITAFTDVDGFQLYGRAYRTNNLNNAPHSSSLEYSISEPTNFTYKALTIQFKGIIPSGGYSDYTETLTFNSNVISLTKEFVQNTSITIGGNPVTFEIYKFSASIPLNIINATGTNSFTIETSIGSLYRRFMLADIFTTFDFDFANSAVNPSCITHASYIQNVLCPWVDNRNNSSVSSEFQVIYRSEFICENTVKSCKCKLNTDSDKGGLNLTFDFDTSETGRIWFRPANSSVRVQGAATLTPSYLDGNYGEGEVYRYHCDIDVIPIKRKLSDNLNDGYYDDNSEIAKYLVRRYVTSLDQSFTLDKNSKVEFHATGNGTITILDIESDPIYTIPVSTAQDEYFYFEQALNAGTYSYTTSGVTIDKVYAFTDGITITNTVTNNVNKVEAHAGNDAVTLLEFDYSQLTNYNISSTKVSAFNTEFETSYDKYQVFQTVYPYYRNKAGYTIAQLREADIYTSLMTLFGTLHQDSTNSAYYSLFKDSAFTEAYLIELISLICSADDYSYGLLLNNLNSSYYLELLLSFEITEVKINIARGIYNIADDDLTSNVANYIYAAYLGNDYLSHSGVLTDSIMYDLLASFNDGVNGAGYYQFITSNTTVDADKVTLLISYLSNNSNINIDGYGIFALSSSQGIGYGIFIPDNMDLSVLDVYYQKATMKNSSNVDVTVLKPYSSVDGSGNPVAKSSEWRGGAVLSSAVSGTVDYAFYHDMKQLIQSISTDIFELNFNNNSIKSVDDQIDNEKGVVTYYLSLNDINALNTGSTLTISKQKLANGAKISSDGTTLVTSVSLSGADITSLGGIKTSIVKTNAIRVYAEDITVYKDYTIKLLLGSVGIDSITLSPTTIPDGGDLLTATVTGTFPAGMDLEPYIHILEDSVEYTTGDGYWRLDPSVTNNAIVNSDGNGATIVLIIDKSLPGNENDGENGIEFKLDILGNTPRSAYFKKTRSTGNSITYAEYQGVQIFKSGTSQSSSIQFGRAFDYSELTDYTSPNFYLNKFEVSDNAKVEITASYSNVKNGNSNTGRIAYSVKIKLTSETGATKTYTHTLTESTYFAGSEYASLYADGIAVGTIDTTSITGIEKAWDACTQEEREEAWKTISDEDIRQNYLYDGTFTYTSTSDEFDGTVGSSLALTDTINLHVAFNRATDREPQYRVKYKLGNFYTLGASVVMAPTEATIQNGTSVSNTYAGMTVTVSNNNRVGKYTYVYYYKNTGEWINEEQYERYYEFPELYISKLASTDALLHKLTFLEEAISIGDTATVILPNQVLVPNFSGDYYDTDEDYGDVQYNTVFTGARDIQVLSSGIRYRNESDAKNIKDYFAIGTVSDADLTNYCPTFGIDEAAQIYKYTTLLKITSYGGNQKATDKEILTNHESTMYLYVPFIYTEDSKSKSDVFLVELDSNNNWTNVYRKEFNGSNQNEVDSEGKPITVGSFTTTFGAKDASGKAVTDSNNVTYTVSSSTGQVSGNNSLFMDYIGTPLDGHFWYVSYVIFSEDKLAGGTSEGNVRYYHISIIDLTNNIQFYVKVWAPSDFAANDLYLTISENIYDGTTKTSTRQISAYAERTTTIYSGNRTDIKGYRLYTLAYDLQSLPSGYFYFYIDLPEGYVAVAYTDMTNQLSNTDPNYANETGSFVPKTAIITQKVNLEMVISQGSASDTDKWAVAISDNYTVQAVYQGNTPSES